MTEFKPILHDLPEFIIRNKMDELNISKGWDEIPEGYYGASILSYRGDSVWHFRRKAEPRMGEPEYSLIEIPDYKNIPNFLQHIQTYLTAQNSVRRTPAFSFLN